jgi:hypothetical protein
MENTIWFTRNGQQHTGAVFDINSKTGVASFSYTAFCKRCGGAGGADHWKFTGWTCYECGGSGGKHTKVARVYTSEKLAKLNATAKAKSDKKIATIQAKRLAQLEAIAPVRAEWIANNQELYSAIHKRAGAENEFFESLCRSITERGCLSDKQQAAAEASIKRDEDRKAKAANAKFVGNKGERITITLTVKRMIQLGGDYGRYSLYGTQYLVICEDQNGNTITYKGASPFASEGETATIAATVKSHTTYNSMPQTQVARCKVLQSKVN